MVRWEVEACKTGTYPFAIYQNTPPLSFKAVVSARENLYLYRSKLCCLNELKAGQDERFLSPRLRTKSSSLVFGSQDCRHPLAPNLSSCPLLHPSRAETQLRPEKGSPHVILAPESWLGAALAGQRQLAWPAGNTTPLPAESLGGQQPDERWQAKGNALSGRPGGCRFSFLSGLDDSGKRVGGRNSETLTRWRPLSLPSQEVSPPSLVLETKPCFLEELASALESQGGCLARSEGVSFRGLARPPPPVHLSPTLPSLQVWTVS